MSDPLDPAYLDSLADPLDVPRYRNAAHAAFTIIREEGIMTLYRGVSLTALRQATNQGRSEQLPQIDPRCQLHCIPTVQEMGVRGSTFARIRSAAQLPDHDNRLDFWSHGTVLKRAYRHHQNVSLTRSSRVVDHLLVLMSDESRKPHMSRERPPSPAWSPSLLNFSKMKALAPFTKASLRGSFALRPVKQSSSLSMSA